MYFGLSKASSAEWLSKITICSNDQKITFKDSKEP